MQMPVDEDPQTELLVSGTITPNHASQTPVEVRRGMAILTRDGQEAGTVAAVVVDKADQSVTHLLLSRLSHLPEYRLVPLDLVAQVSDETVRLGVFPSGVECRGRLAQVPLPWAKRAPSDSW